MIIKSLVYILQSENYNLLRFLRFVYKRLNWWKLEKRNKFVPTPKANLISFLSFIIFFCVVAILIETLAFVGFFISLFLIFFLPLIISFSSLIVKPIDYLLKKRRFKKAKSILASVKLISIGITGSYGKTSTKEILEAVLSQRFRVLKTPENVNTDIGIADFIIKNSKEIKEHDVFIVEMGAYKTGDIAKICDIINPDYSVLTGINESHLERFGNLENIIKGKFELPERTTKISFLNFDDENIKNNFSRFKISEIVRVASDEVDSVNLKDNFGGLEFNYKGKSFSTKLLAKHNIPLILLSIKVAETLGMNYEQINKGVSIIKPFSHRLEPIYNSQSDIWVIDDSYNANFNGIISGLEVLSRANGRKVVLTPGLVELGDKTQEIHNKIGEAFSKRVDLVLIIKNSVTKYILEGLQKNNFQEFKIYNSADEAHKDLINILKAGDTIIFQNDWPDNYL